MRSAVLMPRKPSAGKPPPSPYRPRPWRDATGRGRAHSLPYHRAPCGRLPSRSVAQQSEGWQSAGRASAVTTPTAAAPHFCCRSQRLVEGNELGSDRPLMLLQQPGSRLAAEGLDVVEPGPSAVELGELEDVPAVEPQTSRTRVLSGQRRSRPRMLPARLVLERRG